MYRKGLKRLSLDSYFRLEGLKETNQHCHCLFGSTRFRARHFVTYSCRSCRHCRPPRCHAALVRRRYTAVSALPSCRRRCCSDLAEDVHRRHQSVDVCQQILSEHRQDRAPMGRVKIAYSHTAGRRHCFTVWSRSAAWGHHFGWFESWPARIRCQCNVLLL